MSRDVIQLRILKSEKEKIIKVAEKLDYPFKANVSEYIRRAVNYCAKNKIKL